VLVERGWEGLFIGVFCMASEWHKPYSKQMMIRVEFLCWCFYVLITFLCGYVSFDLIIKLAYFIKNI
jgi:hypothetical protein